MQLHSNLCRYWSYEATSEWLLSIKKFIDNKQMSSIKQAQYINLIIDETQNISVKQMISICLRYVEQETGVNREELFKLGPILDTIGEGMSGAEHMIAAMECVFW